MMGLILKDMINLKTQLKYYGVFIVLYGAFSIYTQSASFLSAIICVFCAMMPMTALGYDEKTHWDKFALTMPVSRRDLVISKYLLGLGFILVGFAVALGLGLFLKMEFFESLLFSGAFALAAIAYMSLTIPLMFRLGTEKSRILMLVILMLPVGIVMVGAKMGIRMPDLDPMVSAAVFVAAAVVLLIASIAVSIGIYEKKEF